MKEGHGLISGKAKGSRKGQTKTSEIFAGDRKKTANGVTRRNLIHPNKKVLWLLWTKFLKRKNMMLRLHWWHVNICPSMARFFKFIKSASAPQAVRTDKRSQAMVAEKAGHSGSQCFRVFDKSTKAGGMKAALPSTQSFTSVTSVSGSRYYIQRIGGGIWRKTVITSCLRD